MQTFTEPLLLCCVGELYGVLRRQKGKWQCSSLRSWRRTQQIWQPLAYPMVWQVPRSSTERHWVSYPANGEKGFRRKDIRHIEFQVLEGLMGKEVQPEVQSLVWSLQVMIWELSPFGHFPTVLSGDRPVGVLRCSCPFIDESMGLSSNRSTTTICWPSQVQ